jgi:predicted transposase/invertase (TIGR01784 family)
VLKDVEFNFIELPKFNKALTELENLTNKWIYFIKNAENLDVIPDNVDDEGLKSAYQEANKHTWTKEELDAYDYAYMREEDEKAKLDFAEKKGKELEKIEIAKKLITMGLENDSISKATGYVLSRLRNYEMRLNFKKKLSKKYFGQPYFIIIN